MNVEDFLKNTDHPLKKELLELRKIIRDSDKTLTEQIKWNAPSFCHKEDDRITFNLARRDSLLLIFHRGAKAKKIKFPKPILTKNTDILEWPSNDRAVMKFKNMAEVNKNKETLQSIVREWIKVTMEYDA
jgi:uncharacterized protein YdeI (YjbR/CyaY-like superfamily)